MKKFFSSLGQRLAYEKACKTALDFAKSGDKTRSFEMFNKLVHEHPHDVMIRRQLLLLGKELGKDVDLPSETVSTLKHK